MLQFLRRKIQFLGRKIRHSKGVSPEHAKEKVSPFSGNLSRDLEEVKSVLGFSKDLIIKEFFIEARQKIKAAILMIDGMIDKKDVDEQILRPLILNPCLSKIDERADSQDLAAYIEYNVLTAADIKKTPSMEAAVDGILSGDTVLLLDGFPKAFIISTRGWETRSISEPETDPVVRGPREGFVETLRINTAMLRRKIKDSNLTIEQMRLGRKTKTDICIAYLKNVANPELVNEVKNRLQRVDVDSVLESGYLEEYIEDSPFSIFPTVGISEKPDVIAAKVLEGRVAVMTDGTPIVLTVPLLFVEAFQSADDYYSRPYYSSLVRLLRFGAFLVSILLPAIYISVTTFHQELIPTALLYTMAAAREGTPFPAFIEAMMMGAVFEILREASVRMPRPTGQAVSIVGALVIGQSAVTAGLIGAPMVIIVAVTAIASFVTPNLLDVGTLLRAYFSVLSAAMGLFGIMIGLIGLLIHLVTIRSFGVPFLSPIAPMIFRDLKDVILRVPMWLMAARPRSIEMRDSVRQEFLLMPGEDDEKEPDKKRDA
ncbi:MAG: spore germination protein [Tepidanaerobacteraceae bacterium]|nr:spore germination protein [Tepidanaerobacteraceae bacterium]